MLLYLRSIGLSEQVSKKRNTKINIPSYVKTKKQNYECNTIIETPINFLTADSTKYFITKNHTRPKFQTQNSCFQRIKQKDSCRVIYLS